MPKKQDFSKKILSALSQRQAIKVSDLKGDISSKKSSKTEGYAITRSIKNLADTGLIETIRPDSVEYARITQKGRQRLSSLKLDSKNSIANIGWDGKWRIVLLDLPESRKAERESLRYLLKKAGFICLKNSAWISPFPFEFMFKNIKKDFGLSTELMIFVTEDIDEETKEFLFESFGK